jgi:hypothetical protein
MTLLASSTWRPSALGDLRGEQPEVDGVAPLDHRIGRPVAAGLWQSTSCVPH